MSNTKKIQAAMVLRGYTLKTLAKELKISITSLFNKIHNKNEFTASEINTMCEKLRIENKDEYFFV